MAFASRATSSLPPLLLLLFLLPLPLLAANNKPRRCRLCNRATRKRFRLPAALNEYEKKGDGVTVQITHLVGEVFLVVDVGKTNGLDADFFSSPSLHPLQRLRHASAVGFFPLFFSMKGSRRWAATKERPPRSPLAAEPCHSGRQPIAFEAALTSAHLRVFFFMNGCVSFMLLRLFLKGQRRHSVKEAESK